MPFWLLVHQSNGCAGVKGEVNIECFLAVAAELSTEVGPTAALVLVNCTAGMCINTSLLTAAAAAAAGSIAVEGVRVCWC